MDSQNSSKRLFFLVIIMSLLNVVVAFDLKVSNITGSNRTSSFIDSQGELRSFIESTENQSLGKILNDFNKVVSGGEIISGNGLTTLLILSFATLLISILTVMAPESNRKWLDRISLNKNNEYDKIELSAMERAIADIASASDHLDDYVESLANQKPSHSPKDTIESQFDEIVTLAAHIRSISKELIGIQDSFLNVDRLLQKLSSQCGDNAHFASATRLEWNTMGNKLRQLQEHHDKIKAQSEKTVKIQTSCTENLHKTLEFNRIYTGHSEKVRANLGTLYENARGGYRNLDEMSSSIGVSKVDVDKASELVKGLSQRAEAIVNIIDVIDDIAEQTNQLALNASIEAARAGEQGQGFAVVAGEVRNLAARSSTATKSITDLLGTIQEEAEQASQLLERSKDAVSSSYLKIKEVDKSYRESLILARHSVTGLDVLMNDVTTHFLELKQIEKANHEVKKLCNKTNTLLDEHGDMNAVLNSEGNQLTVHTDRLSRILTRQYYEVNHCQRLLLLTTGSVSAIKTKIEQSITNTESMKHNLDHLYKASMNDESRFFNHNVAAIKSIQTLKSSTRTLHLIQNPITLHTNPDIRSNATVAQNSRTKEVANKVRESTISNMPKDDIFIGDNKNGNKAG